MPNWCNNNLTVSGKPDDVKRFRLKAKGAVQNYNDYRGNEWEAFDDIRLIALTQSPPELGDSSDLSFHRLYPVPNEVMSLPYDAGSRKKILTRLGMDTSGTSGYNWEVNHWGVKWGARDVHAHEDDSGEYIRYDFDTAWGPPMDFMTKIAEDFPELGFSLSYEEPGMAFAGEVIWENGECVSEDSWEIEHDDDEDEDCDEQN